MLCRAYSQARDRVQRAERNPDADLEIDEMVELYQETAARLSPEIVQRQAKQAKRQLGNGVTG